MNVGPVIGFILNPIAGMGGAVGLKGTDTREVLEEAVRRGAKQRSHERARLALEGCFEDLKNAQAKVLACAGPMGEALLRDIGTGLDIEVAYRPADASRTSGADTINAAKAMKEHGAGLILFCGGDGTASDINSVIGQDILVLGIPAGVKMHSGVFATTPAAVCEILSSYLKGEAETVDAEVMDIDEDAYRDGRLQVKLHGLAKVPKVGELIQASKSVFHQATSEVLTLEIAEYFQEIAARSPDTCFFLGAGSTLAAIKKALGMTPTVLGIDAYLRGEQIGTDLSESGILKLMDERCAKAYAACVSPIGAQGFILGRGSQQFSPAAIQRIGVENFYIVATPDKLASIGALRVDTGDPQLDKAFEGYKRVINGFRTQRLTKLIT